MSRMPEALLSTNALYRRLYAEADLKTFFAVARLDNLEPHIIYAPGAAVPIAEQLMMMRDITLALNKHLHHDGSWLMLAIEPRIDMTDLLNPQRLYDQLAMLWFDHQGDCQFTVELEGQLWQQLAGGVDGWVQRAEEAWQRWQLMMVKVLAPKPDQQYARALGEKAPSERATGLSQQAIRTAIELD